MTPWLNVALAALWVAASSASAQTVYRCGPDGNQYSQTPCVEGRAVDVGDERTVEQRAAAETKARDDAARARLMERERRANEAAARPALAGKLDSHATVADKDKTAPPEKKTKKKKRKRAQATDDFKAVTPLPPKKPKSGSS